MFKIVKNTNDAIILWNTYVKCSCLSQMTILTNGLGSISFDLSLLGKFFTSMYIHKKKNLSSKFFQIDFKS